MVKDVGGNNEGEEREGDGGGTREGDDDGRKVRGVVRERTGERQRQRGGLR